jgi:molybdenum cofactor cytidylyltransferase
MISAILLAAGQSKRMQGENKLTKEINGIPLIKYAVKNILGSTVDELVIVVGHEKEILERTIEDNKKIKFVYNSNFTSGVASSIKIGLENISKRSEAFFICLGDMPNVSQNIYNKLIKSRNNYNKKFSTKYKKEIIIPTFEEQYGNPILFSKYMKEKIMQVKGDTGAKKILELYKKNIIKVKINNRGVLENFNTKDSFNL